MTISGLAFAAVALLQAASPDTVITKVVETDRGWIDTLVSIEQAIVGLGMLILLGMAVGMLFALRKSVQELTKLLQSSWGDVAGAAHTIRNVADDVKGITQTVRREVEEVGGTVHSANEKLRLAMSGTEERVRRLGALVDVAQGEAEELVVSTAATLHGVRDGMRAGVWALRRGFMFVQDSNGNRVRRQVRRPDRRRAPEEPASAAEVSDDRGDAEALPERPTVRSARPAPPRRTEA